MPTTGFVRRLAAVLLVVCLTPAAAGAQQAPASVGMSSLRLPTMVAGAAAAADWASTYHALTHYRVRETNPLLQAWQGSPGRLVTMGAVMDVGMVSAWNLTVGQKHPQVAVAGLWAMAAFRGYLAIHNLRNTRRVPRR